MENLLERRCEKFRNLGVVIEQSRRDGTRCGLINRPPLTQDPSLPASP